MLYVTEAISTESMSVQAKFVLEALVRARLNGQWDDERAWTSTSLASLLGIPSKMAARCLHELLRCRFIYPTRVPGGRGRPSISYAVEQRVLDDCSSAPSQSQHVALLDHLFVGDGLHASEDPQEPRGSALNGDCKAAHSIARTERLTLINRWIFAVLLSHADVSGVLWGVGTADLARIAGFTKIAIEHDLTRLRELGLINRMTSGYTSKIFLKGRVPRMYYLNLAHPIFDGLGQYIQPSSEVWDLEACAPLGAEVSGERACRGRHFPSVRQFLGPEQSPRVIETLQASILRAAVLELFKTPYGLIGTSDILGEPDVGCLRLRKPNFLSDGSHCSESQWAEIIQHFKHLIRMVVTRLIGNFELGSGRWIKSGYIDLVETRGRVALIMNSLVVEGTRSW